MNNIPSSNSNGKIKSQSFFNSQQICLSKNNKLPKINIPKENSLLTLTLLSVQK